MERILTYDSLAGQEERFWPFFFCAGFPNGYLEEEDLGLDEYLQERYGLDMDWVHGFTQSDDSVWEAGDGYVDAPRTLLADLNGGSSLKIAFHPGDTLFFLDEEEVGSTGPHFFRRGPSWSRFLALVDGRGPAVFFLLLPVVRVTAAEAGAAERHIRSQLPRLPFSGNRDPMVLRCILADLLEEPQTGN